MLDIKDLRVHFRSEPPGKDAVKGISLHMEPGEILGLVEKGVGIALDGRVLIADEVQLEGKNRNTAKEFLNGAGRKYAGTCLK